MSDHIAKLKAAYQSWNDSKGMDTAPWMALVDDHVAVRSIADGAAGMEFTAPRKGKGDLDHYFSGMQKDWEMVHFTPAEFIADGDHVAVRGTCAWKSRRTGKTVETPMAQFWTFLNGKVVDYHDFYDTAKAIAAAAP